MKSHDILELTGRQLRAARALAGVTAESLARQALIGVATVRRAELTDGPVKITRANARRIADALLELGVEFTEQEGARRKAT